MSLGRLLMFIALVLAPMAIVLGERRSGVWEWGALLVAGVIFVLGWRLEKRNAGG
ncbi:MAG: hypothetical protein RL885_27835 [Planctomycetota bacterium]